MVIIMKENIGDLGKTEWELLNICWEKGPKTTAKEVHEASLANRYRSYVTVKTILDRLVDKGYLTRTKLGPIWLYSPDIKKQKVISEAIDDFLSTVMNRDRVMLVRNLLKGDMRPEEFEEIKAMIEQYCAE